MIYILSFILILFVVYGLYSLKQVITTLKSCVKSLESELEKLKDWKECNSGTHGSSKSAPDTKNISKCSEKCSGNKPQNNKEKQPEKDETKSNASDVTSDERMPVDEVASQSKDKEECVSKEKLDGLQETFLYATQFDKGELKICNISDAFYKLQMVSDDEAKFEFCGDLSRAMNNFNAVFDDVIDHSGSSSSATKCNTVEKGEAKRISDSKWKVVKKAKIEFLL